MKNDHDADDKKELAADIIGGDNRKKKSPRPTRLANIGIDMHENGYTVNHRLKVEGGDEYGPDSKSESNVFSHPDGVRDHVHKLLMDHHFHGAKGNKE